MAAVGTAADRLLGGEYKACYEQSMTIDVRNAVTMSLIQHVNPAVSSVLDVACAAARLAGVAAARGVQRYVGFDRNAAGIEWARQVTQEIAKSGACRIDLAVADLTEFSPPGGERFDAIVFNEVLYYLDVADAITQTRRYARMLRPGGLLSISLKDDGKSKLLVRRLKHHFDFNCGTLLQETSRPLYRTQINRATPAFLFGLWRPKAIGR